jgi:hypothetical protein
VKDPLREAMLECWELIYQIQVLIAPLDAAMLDQVSDRMTSLSYRVHVAKQRAKPSRRPIQIPNQTP